MTVIRDDRASGITVVFLGRLFAFHERDQVLGGDRYLLTDSGRCFTGRDTGYITQRNDVLVVSPAQVTCCGWAGDRGFFYPELNASGLHYLKPNLHGATEGYSNSRTCEIGLTMNSGISYKSIVYLVEKATR